MPDIDPTDVLPVNNLPAPSAPWGRAMEKRLRETEKRLRVDNQEIQGQNRSIAAQLQALSDQITRIGESVTFYTNPTPTILNSRPDPYWGASWEIPVPSWASAGAVMGTNLLASAFTSVLALPAPLTVVHSGEGFPEEFGTPSSLWAELGQGARVDVISQSTPQVPVEPGGTLYSAARVGGTEGVWEVEGVFVMAVMWL